MSAARARANHELYLAKIVTSAWRRELAREDVAARTLAQAFQDNVRCHLVAAYGWFLVAITQADAPLQGLPMSCEELPPMPEGRVFPPEINEFRQLEGSGWLCEMLQATPDSAPMAQQPGNLAVSVASPHTPEQVEHWQQQLQQLFERMDGSLDEY